MLDLLLSELRKEKNLPMLFKIGFVSGEGRRLMLKRKRFIPGSGFVPYGDWEPITLDQAKAFLASPANSQVGAR